MNKSLKIYIAGPYSAETAEQRLQNVNVAIDAALQVFFKGHFPYVPHLTHYVDERANATNITMRWEDYITWDMPWVAACEALLYLRSSRGADLELKAAQALGKQIFYSVDEIPTVVRHDSSASHQETSSLRQ